MNSSNQKQNPAEANLAGDLLIGAEAIARALNWRKRDGSWNRRRVYV